MSNRLGRAAAAFASNARNPGLRRAQLSFLAAWTAEWTFTVGLGIVAYRHGGAGAVGLVALLRMVPSAVLAPLLAPLADRGRRERVLVAVSTMRTLATALAALVIGLSGPAWVVYLLAVPSTIAATLYRPAHSALLPSLCHTGYDLASAYVVRGLLDSAAALLGPLLAAVLLRAAGVTAVVTTAAVASAAAALLVLRLRYEASPRPPAPRVGLVASAVEGVGAVARSADLASIMGLVVAQTLVRGALTVLTVVVAIDLLGAGESWVGLLTAAIGAGAVAGSLAASLLVDTRALGGWFALGVVLWGVPVTLMGVVPERTAALLLLGLVGVGNALVDLGAFTLLGRMASDEVLARVFGVLESVIALSVGVGAVLTSVLLGLVDVRLTLVLVGLLCPVAAVLAWPRLRGMDRSLGVRDHDLELLRGVPMLAALPLPAIEQLARGLTPVEVPAGRTVVTQGDVGDCYYVIEAGRAEVIGDGRVVAGLGPGEGFGEIALVRGVRRTATVRAASDLQMRVLGSEHFLAVVLGFPPSARTAGTSVEALLDRFGRD